MCPAAARGPVAGAGKRPQQHRGGGNGRPRNGGGGNASAPRNGNAPQREGKPSWMKNLGAKSGGEGRPARKDNRPQQGVRFGV